MADRPGALGAWPGGRILVLSPTPTHPQDYGNRKRIHQVCSRFADEGARITFLHYPAEFEWRGTLPVGAERAMRQAWHQYYTIPPTRYLHAKPAGYHHLIDEWWDDSIGQFLGWLFSVQSFDAFIVNYSWLSKAFEFAPSSTFKILDTHDKVSGRLEMLSSLGLNPEFFYTTEDEEGVALQRADLVWAIKNEERALFERMSATPVLTLPHLDSARALKAPAPDPDGFLRVGVIGARNNVNRMNIAEFLKAAEPFFLESFAPVRIVIAGSVCDLLKEASYPFVEMRGRIDDIDDFYRSVDCVAVPMRDSTGLKIKVGEALSLGRPLLSLAHAFEGYQPSHPLHRLADFTQMARALADLSFAPRADLDGLAGASRDSHAKSNAQMAAAFGESDARVRAGEHSIVLTVDSRAFIPGHAFNLALMSMQDYLRTLANVTVLVVRGSAGDVLGNPVTVDRLRRVVVAGDVAGAAEARTALEALGACVFDAGAYLRRTRPKVLVVDAMHSVLSDRPLPDTAIIFRMEMIAHSQASAAFRPPARGYRQAFLAAPRMTRDVAVLAAELGVPPLLVSCFCRQPEIRLPRARETGAGRVLAILGARDAPAVRKAAAMARAWNMQPHIICGFGDAGANAKAGAIRPDEYIEQVLSGGLTVPAAAVDLSAGLLGTALCREILELLQVPMLTGSASALHRSIDVEPAFHRVTTERELWNAVRAIALLPAAELRAKVRQGIEGDWHWLQRHSRDLFAARTAA